MSYSISKKITQTVASLSLVAFFASVSQVALADDSAAVKTIAGVLVGLNHFPSADDKAALAAIADRRIENGERKVGAQAVCVGVRTQGGLHFFTMICLHVHLYCHTTVH